MTKPSILKLTPIALAVLAALPVYAQTTDQSATEQEAGELEEVIVTGSQIKGAAINDALSVSVIDMQAIDDFGIESGEELLDAMPEQGQNFFNEAENIAGGGRFSGGMCFDSSSAARSRTPRARVATMARSGEWFTLTPLSNMAM